MKTYDIEVTVEQQQFMAHTHTLTACSVVSGRTERGINSVGAVNSLVFPGNVFDLVFKTRIEAKCARIPINKTAREHHREIV